MTATRLRYGPFGAFARIGGAALLMAIAGVAASTQAFARDPLKLPGSQYEPTTWAKVDGWIDDDHDDAFATFLKSCRAVL